MHTSTNALYHALKIDTLVIDPNPTVDTYRHYLKNITHKLHEYFDQNTPIAQLVLIRAKLVDGLLLRLWKQHFSNCQGKIALIAVGGYGRNELLPASDIDILVLLQKNKPATIKSNLEDFITSLWDIGLDIGHSVRSLPECITLAKNDITIATNLMEARLIIGDNDLFNQLRQYTNANHIWPSRQFFEAKWHEQQQRHLRYNDTAYNLEPNIKEGPGGLRDIQMIGWVTKRHYGAGTLENLVKLGFLTTAELEALQEGQEFLWKIRFALHKNTGRREDRLLFDYQQTIATQFGYQDETAAPNSSSTESTKHRASDGRRLGVELFMKQYYRTIMELSRLNEMLLQFYQETILYDHAVVNATLINHRFQTHKGFIEVTYDDVFKRYPFALLEIFLLLQQNPLLKGVRASTIRLIRNHRYLIDNKFRQDIRCYSLFMEIMRQPQGITHQLRRMNRYGILAAYIPAFASIVGQMQYDLFHEYTVDEHSLFVVRNLRRFMVPEFQYEFPHCSKIIATIPKPELLFLGGLFHDIAKGRGGDHSTLGADEARAFCQRHQLSEPDTALVAWLVQHHLLMSATAQRKDISDPDVVYDFAIKVQDNTRLNYLYLLTAADMRATNTKLWNKWKEALLIELYRQTQRCFQRGIENPLDKRERIHETQLQARKQLVSNQVVPANMDALWHNIDDDYFLSNNADDIAWHCQGILNTSAISHDTPLVLIRSAKQRGGTDIFIHAPYAKHIFANITATLDKLHLTIVEARIGATKDFQLTLDTYSILEDNGEMISDDARKDEIKHKVKTCIIENLPPKLPAMAKKSRVSRVFSNPTDIQFILDERNHRTAMAVSATDRPGFLSVIAYSLYQQNITLKKAKIATFGIQIDDVFFITDVNHNPILDPWIKRDLQNHICQFLDH